MKSLLEYLVKSLVKNPDEVKVVETRPADDSVTLQLHVNQEDMGRVIGRSGRTARALRHMVAARGTVDNVKTRVDIEDGEQPSS